MSPPQQFRLGVSSTLLFILANHAASSTLRPLPKIMTDDPSATERSMHTLRLVSTIVWLGTHYSPSLFIAYRSGWIDTSSCWQKFLEKPGQSFLQLDHHSRGPNASHPGMSDLGAMRAMAVTVYMYLHMKRTWHDTTHP